MKKLLKTKVSRLESFPKQLLAITIVGISVFIFLIVFKPFHIKHHPVDMQVFLATSYAISTFIIPFIFISFRGIFKLPFFEKQNWTVGKEILTALFILLPIALLYFLIDINYNNVSKSLFGYLIALEQVCLLAIIPMLIIIILKVNILLQSKVAQREKIEDVNIDISKKEKQSINPIHKNEIENESPGKIVTIKSENKSDEFNLNLESFNYAISEGNYVDIIYNQNGTIKKKTIRGTLKRLQQDLSMTSSIVQCHRSYLINSKKISSIQGNSRGYKIKISNDLPSIPVSRKYISSIKNVIDPSLFKQE